MGAGAPELEVYMKDKLMMEVIERRIYLIRGQKVMLDRDLAELYEVETKALNRAVHRNMERFPLDFAFQLTVVERENLRCQIGTSSWGGSRYLPFAFTEQGVAMLSSVLRSKRAAFVNIAIMRAFVRLRQVLSTNVELAKRLETIEKRLFEHGDELSQHKGQIKEVFDAIRDLMADPAKAVSKIGFK